MSGAEIGLYHGMSAEHVEKIMEFAGIHSNPDELALAGLQVFCEAYMKPDTGEGVLSTEPLAKEEPLPEDQPPVLSELSPMESVSPLVAEIIIFYGSGDNRRSLLEPALQARLRQAFDAVQRHEEFVTAPLLQKLILQLMAHGIQEGKNPGYRTFAQIKQVHDRHVEHKFSSDSFESTFVRAVRLLDMFSAVETETPMSPPIAPVVPKLTSQITFQEPKVLDSHEQQGVFVGYGDFGQVLSRLIDEGRLEADRAARIQNHALRAIGGVAAGKLERDGDYHSELRDDDASAVARLYEHDGLYEKRLLPTLLHSNTPINEGLMLISSKQVERAVPPREVDPEPRPYAILAWSLSKALAHELQIVVERK